MVSNMPEAAPPSIRNPADSDEESEHDDAASVLNEGEDMLSIRYGLLYALRDADFTAGVRRKTVCGGCITVVAPLFWLIYMLFYLQIFSQTYTLDTIEGPGTCFILHFNHTFTACWVLK